MSENRELIVFLRRMKEVSLTLKIPLSDVIAGQHCLLLQEELEIMYDDQMVEAIQLETGTGLNKEDIN